MAQSELINELCTALSKAQGEMQSAIKDKVNPYFRSKYADLSAVWDVARPVLSKHGLCVIQTTQMIPNSNQIVLVTTLAHCSGQWISSELPLNPAKNDSQGVGAAITYLRRYSLSAIVGVVCDEDDDGETASGRGNTQNNNSVATKTNQQIEKISEKEAMSIADLLDDLDQTSKDSFMSWIKKTFKAQNICDIPKNSYGKCIASLNAKIKSLNSNDTVAVA